MRLLFLLFIVMPILEMWVLIKVGSIIGAVPTIAMVMLTAVIGASLLKRQGLHTLTRAQNRLNSGEVPATEILEGLMLAVGGALLLTPGFFTDAIGFACLIPGLRRSLIANMLRRGVVQMHGGGFMGGGPAGGANNQADRSAQQGHVTIEGEYKKEE
jgi:UPF0716 protein FxsA